MFFVFFYLDFSGEASHVSSSKTLKGPTADLALCLQPPAKYSVISFGFKTADALSCLLHVWKVRKTSWSTGDDATDLCCDITKGPSQILWKVLQAKEVIFFSVSRVNFAKHGTFNAWGGFEMF